VDPDKVTGILAMVTAVIAFVMAPFKVFQTKRAAEKTYLKKVEDDGRRLYVHTEDFTKFEQIHAEVMAASARKDEQIDEFQRICRDWMKNP
jgi:uncharacterized protein YxeA